MTASDAGHGDAGTGTEQTADPSLVPLLKVVGRKQVTHLVRYPINTAALFASMFVFFAMIFFGGQAVAGPTIADSADGLVVGFFVWTMATRAFRVLAANVMNEARWGTLERLFMSPYGLGTVLAVETLVNVVLSIVWGSVMLLLMMLVTGRWLHVDPLTVMPLVLLTLTPFVGIGFLMGGLALLYKRVENLFGIVTFGFAGLIAAPAGQFELLKLLPATQGSYLTRVAMEDGVYLWEFPTTDLVLLVVPAVTYLVLGFYCFHRAQHRARREGLMGQY